jgi:PAS domain S-box-containing protein
MIGFGTGPVLNSDRPTAPAWGPELGSCFLNQTPDLVLVLDVSATVLYANPEAQGRLGTDVVGRALVSMVREDQRTGVSASVLSVLSGADAGPLVVPLHLGVGYYFQARFSRLQMAAEVFVVCVAVDVGLYHEGHQRLLESEARYRTLAENSLDIISENLLDGTTLYVSPSALRVTGFTAEERLHANTFDRVHPADKPGIQAAVASLMEDGHGRMTFRYQRKDGVYIYLEAVARRVQNPYMYEGKLFMVVVSRDVSDRVTMLKQLEQSVKEKEILLSEIHHRVKNNLQIISSLLSLQSQFVKDADSQSVFLDCQSRIKSIALIHETLYQSRNLSRIDFAAYASNLVERLAGSYLGYSNRVTVDVPSEDVCLPIDLAISCGLIVNELVTNALKYAFPGDRKGHVDITIAYDAHEQQFCLKVSDNGVGIPAHVDLDNPVTLGLQLVMTLAQQLDAMVDVDNKGGTTFKLYFAVPVERLSA